MSFSAAMINRIKTYCTLFLFTWAYSLNAQVVNIRLEIPAGVSYESVVLDPLLGGSWEKNKAKAWISLDTRENLSFLLEVKTPDRKIEPAFEIYFLNNGTADFEMARKLSTGIHELQMINPPRLIRNMDDAPAFLRAWLGVPLINGLKFKIEYP